MFRALCLLVVLAFGGAAAGDLQPVLVTSGGGPRCEEIVIPMCRGIGRYFQLNSNAQNKKTGDFKDDHIFLNEKHDVRSDARIGRSEQTLGNTEFLV